MCIESYESRGWKDFQRRLENSRGLRLCFPRKSSSIQTASLDLTTDTRVQTELVWTSLIGTHNQSNNRSASVIHQYENHDTEGDTIRNGPGTPSDRMAINASRYDTDRPLVEILQGHYALTVTPSFGASNPPKLPRKWFKNNYAHGSLGSEGCSNPCLSDNWRRRVNFPYQTTMKPLKMADQANWNYREHLHHHGKRLCSGSHKSWILPPTTLFRDGKPAVWTDRQQFDHPPSNAREVVLRASGLPPFGIVLGGNLVKIDDSWVSYSISWTSSLWRVFKAAQ